MPVININRDVFEKYVGKKLPTDKLKDRISYFGTDLEEVTDDEITVEIFPNRPDMLSVQGFGRAFSSFLGVNTGLRNYPIKKSSEKMIVDSSVADVRPYTACCIVKNLKFDDEKIKEVIEIQEKLHITYGRNRKKVAIGIYPFEKIKMPITFTAEDPKKIVFRPLEAAGEMNALEILEKHPAGKTYGYLLEGKKKFPVFREANGEVLSLPPIINSHTTGKVSESTTEVFIECSGFDFEVMKKCLNMIVAALSEMGGDVYSMELDYGKKKFVTPDMNPEEMTVDFDYINKLLGLELKEKEFKELFERMGYGYKNKKVQVPAYRADILHQADLAEDISIAFGFENFEAIIPDVATTGEEDPFAVFKGKVVQLLVGLGFLQTSTYNLTNVDTQFKKMNVEMDYVQLANPISSDYDVLRAWMLPSVIGVLGDNKHNEFPQKVFSIGTVFSKDKSMETGVKEQERIAIAISSEDTDYTDIRQVFDYLLANLGLEGSVKETKHDSFISGRVGRGSVSGKEIAYIGEINPLVLENWELDTPVTALELNLSELFEIVKKNN